jgi:hypothetical protein
VIFLIGYASFRIFFISDDVWVGAIGAAVIHIIKVWRAWVGFEERVRLLEREDEDQHRRAHGG